MKIILQVVKGGFILNVEGSDEQAVCRTYDLMKTIRRLINGNENENDEVGGKELSKERKVHKRRV